MTLPEAIQKAMPPDDNMRIGVVVSRFPTTVNVQGEAVACGSLSSYTPIVGDTVLLFRQDSTWCILGRTTTQAGAFPSFQAGAVDIVVAIATSASSDIVFATPFEAAPSVATNINSFAGPTAGWISRAFNVTNLGFTLVISGASSSFTANCQWQAQEMTQ